ncbi:hypothetical protein [Streptomyces sp. NPDC004728]|uniref:hypothetical protein n=1 Tax=Streptomyces sp. NPDC004728 TaxID=3154289 RepID=UPI0033B2B117
MADSAGNPITGGPRISEAIDSHDILIVHIDQQGLFDRRRQEVGGLARGLISRAGPSVVRLAGHETGSPPANLDPCRAC